MATSVSGVFAAGNVVHVYDLVDDVTESALRAGRFAAEYALRGEGAPEASLRVVAGANVHHVVPQRVHLSRLAKEEVPLQFRVREPVEEAVHAQVRIDEKVLLSRRQRYVRPSEMVTLTLTPEHVGDMAGAEVLEICIAT